MSCSVARRASGRDCRPRQAASAYSDTHTRTPSPDCRPRRTASAYSVAQPDFPSWFSRIGTDDRVPSLSRLPEASVSSSDRRFVSLHVRIPAARRLCDSAPSDQPSLGQPGQCAHALCPFVTNPWRHQPNRRILHVRVAWSTERSTEHPERPEGNEHGEANPRHGRPGRGAFGCCRTGCVGGNHGCEVRGDFPCRFRRHRILPFRRPARLVAPLLTEAARRRTDRAVRGLMRVPRPSAGHAKPADGLPLAGYRRSATRPWRPHSSPEPRWHLDRGTSTSCVQTDRCPRRAPAANSCRPTAGSPRHSPITSPAGGRGGKLQPRARRAHDTIPLPVCGSCRPVRTTGVAMTTRPR